MKKLFVAFLFPLICSAQKDYSALVNPFIGTGGHGHTYPGATMPFGMMQLSPDTRMADWDGRCYSSCVTVLHHIYECR